MIGAKCIECGSYNISGADKWAYANDTLVRQVECLECKTVMQLTLEEVPDESD